MRGNLMKVGDRVKYWGYTEEAFHRGGVPSFEKGEGTIITLDNILYLAFANGYIYPIHYCANVEIL